MSETGRDRIYAAVPAITRNLREFGYLVTDDDVREQVDALAVGQPPTNIIGRMAREMLQKHGLLPQD